MPNYGTGFFSSGITWTALSLLPELFCSYRGILASSAQELPELFCSYRGILASSAQELLYLNCSVRVGEHWPLQLWNTKQLLKGPKRKIMLIKQSREQ